MSLIAATLLAGAATAIDPAGWITAADYPAGARARHQEGAVDYRLEVHADGRVADCAIVRSSGSAILDETTCRLLTARASYRLQRDEHSHPIPFVVDGTIDWRLLSAE